MIRLTKYDGKPVYFNPNKIIMVEPHHENGCFVEYGGEAIRVIETAEEVARKILHYKHGEFHLMTALMKNNYELAADHESDMFREIKEDRKK